MLSDLKRTSDEYFFGEDNGVKALQFVSKSNFSHPTACRYLAKNEHCNGGNNCVYSHKKSETFVKIYNIKFEVNLFNSG